MLSLMRVLSASLAKTHKTHANKRMLTIIVVCWLNDEDVHFFLKYSRYPLILNGQKTPVSFFSFPERATKMNSLWKTLRSNANRRRANQGLGSNFGTLYSG